MTPGAVTRQPLLKKQSVLVNTLLFFIPGTLEMRTAGGSGPGARQPALEARAEELGWWEVKATQAPPEDRLNAGLT